MSCVTLWTCHLQKQCGRGWLLSAAPSSRLACAEFQRRAWDLTAHAGGLGTCLPVPASFSYSWCLGLLTLGLHPRACMGGLALPGHPWGRAAREVTPLPGPPQVQLLADSAGTAHGEGEGAWLASSLSSQGAVGRVRATPLLPLWGVRSDHVPGRRHISFRFEEAPRFKNRQGFFVVDRRCELFPKTSHHEEKGTSFCLHLGLRVPYNVAKGNISQISVKSIIKLQYPHESICFRC